MTEAFRAAQKSEAEKLVAYSERLYTLNRYADAEREARQALARDPQNWTGRYYLALSLLSQSNQKKEKAGEGLAEAKKVLAARPDAEVSHFLLAWAFLMNWKRKECLESAHQGMRINPQHVWGCSLVALAHLSLSDWEKALEAADTGLKYNPDSTTLINVRAEALVMLGRKEEARAAVEMALRSDPSSPRAYANQGWLALYNDDSAAALANFREVIRLDPDSETARAGLVQALHARSPLYKILLRYYLWTRRLTRSELWASWFLISGFNSALRVATRAFPPLLIIFLPYYLLYMSFSFFTWIGDSFFNLLLKLSPSGRLVLSKDESASASGCAFTGSLFFINLLALAAALVLHPGEFRLIWVFLVGMGLSIGMMVPVSGIFKVDSSARKRRAALVVLAVLLGANAACGWGGAFSLAPWHAIPIALFIIGWVIYPWVANLIISAQN